MKKAVLILTLIGLSLLLVPFNASAATTPINIVINGQKFVSPPGEPAPYANKDQRTLIPIRFFAEKLGVPNDEEHIQWDQATQTATITDGKNTVQIPLGSKEIKVNGETVVMDTVAESKNGRIFIPARFLAEGLGAQVYWDQVDNTAVFMTQEYIDNHPAMVTAKMYDINDPYIVYPYFVKYANTEPMQKYGKPEVMIQRIKDVRKIAASIKVEMDEKNRQFIITVPEFDSENYMFTLDTLNNQYHWPGIYKISFDDYEPSNGAIFSYSIADYRTRAYVLYHHVGYTRDGKYYHGEGSAVFKLVFGI